MDINLLPHAKVQNGFGCVDPVTNGEKSILKFLSQKLQLKILFDVGANDGQYSIMLNQYFPESQIYAFEPIDSTFQILEKAISNIKNVHPLKKAVNSTAEPITLFNDLNNHWDKVSTAYPSGLETFFGMKDLESFIVEATTLDKFTTEYEVNHIDFIKIDVEGAEIEVIKGAKNLIKTEKIHIIQFEFNNFNIVAKTYLRDFYNILPNYRFYRLSQSKLYYLGEYNADNENFIYQNLLAVSPSLFDLFKPCHINIS